MPFTKADLRSHCFSIIETRRSEIQARINKTVDGKMEPILDKLDSAMGVSELANNLDAYVDQARQLYHKEKSVFHKDWNHNYKVSYAQQLVDWLRRGKLSDLRDNIRSAVRVTTDNFNFFDEDVNAAVKELQQAVKEDYGLLPKLDTLKNEVDYVIRNSTTAKRAYDALAEMGFDLSDLDVATVSATKALALTKFSVDPSIVKGAAD